MKFSAHLWNRIQPIYRKMVDHPFNQELADGSLSHDTFQFFLHQDQYYLIEYAKALEIIANRVTTDSFKKQFTSLANDTIKTEQDIQKRFLKEKNNKIQLTAASISYIEHLRITTNFFSVEEAVSAILPCLWVYNEIGHEISKQISLKNPYYLWIETYIDLAFSEATKSLICTFDQMADNALPALKEKMTNVFDTSLNLELQFWDEIYRNNES